MAGGRGCTAILMVARIRHEARGIAVGSRLRYVTPTRTRVVWRKRGTSSTCLVRVVVRVFEGFLVGGLAPTPPRPLVFALQRGSASTPVARRRVYNGDCVARRCARGRLVSNWRDRRGANGMALYVGA